MKRADLFRKSLIERNSIIHEKEKEIDKIKEEIEEIKKEAAIFKDLLHFEVNRPLEIKKEKDQDMMLSVSFSSKERIALVSDYIAENGPQRATDIADAVKLRESGNYMVVYTILTRNKDVFCRDDLGRWMLKSIK